MEFDSVDKLVDYIEKKGYKDLKIFRGCDYITAVVDVTENGVVYDYDKMVDYLVEKNAMTYEDAIEWIDYNTLRAIPYMGANPPIIHYDESEDYVE